MLTLTPEELRELTGRARRGDQRAWLEAQGIPFRVDGERLLVSRQHAQDWLSGKVVARSRAVDLSGVSFA
jgi:hypothetical protein